MVSRRRFLTGLVAVPAIAAVPSSASAARRPVDGRSVLARISGEITPELRLVNPHTDERISTRFHTGTGFDRASLQRLDAFARDWRAHEIRPLDRDLFFLLAAVRQAAMKEGHNGELVLLSGFRTQATNDYLRGRSGGVATHSLHIPAQAVDFVVPGVPVEQVAAYTRWLGRGGVGLYRGSGFVHADTGDVREWGF